MGEITQGSILCGIRSNKYPGKRCCGIIISARCDVANCKISKLYYLVALEAQDWFSSECGYGESYAGKTNDQKRKFKEITGKYNLDFESLQNFTVEDVETIIEAQAIPPKEKDLLTALYLDYRLFCCSAMDDDMRRNIIRTDRKFATNYLDKINKGEIVHYYYLPFRAYMDNDFTDDGASKGLIVDLQEIEMLKIDDAEKMQEMGIDYNYARLSANEPQSEIERLNEHFWLETEDDFVIVEHNIKSPWVELLMQRFANTFTRIGVDGATRDDITKLVNSI